mmetsp:Transcript_111357/g.325740  ORF Transcript_111357/g.325740 Transcript_111357/m.325740 type:complete len:215 (-) Transcript_111357:799-1443(-)
MPWVKKIEKTKRMMLNSTSSQKRERMEWRISSTIVRSSSKKRRTRMTRMTRAILNMRMTLPAPASSAPPVSSNPFISRATSMSDMTTSTMSKKFQAHPLLQKKASFVPSMRNSNSTANIVAKTLSMTENAKSAVVSAGFPAVRTRYSVCTAMKMALQMMTKAKKWSKKDHLTNLSRDALHPPIPVLLLELTWLMAVSTFPRLSSRYLPISVLSM